MSFKEIALSFVPLFVAIDPIGILPFILLLTKDIENKKKVIRYAVITGFVLGVCFIGIGKGVLMLLGIEMADFLIAGGLVLLILAIRHLLTGRMIDIEPSLKEIIGVVPIGIPLIVGPAVLTTILLLVERYSIWSVLISFIINLLITYIILIRAELIARILKESGMRIASQIASLLLAAIAVMLIREGVMSILR